MKKMLLAMIAAASFAGAAVDPNFHIYIAYGQSNMGGTAEAQNSDKVANDRFKIIASQVCSQKGRSTLGGVYPAEPSLFNCGNTISVADWFGRTMADSMPDVTIGIVPVAVGGASIKLFDKDQYSTYLSTAEGWLQNYAKEYEPSGNVPKALLDLAKKAQEVGVIKGIIFHQGETDGGYPDWPKIVKKTRDDLLSSLGMSSDSVPFVAGELLRDGCCYSDRVSKLSDVMDNTYYASSEGLSGNGVDRYHFSHDAYVTIGKRYAEQMLKAVNRAPVEPVPQEPFGSVTDGVAVPGAPAGIPGKIEAENYDINGVGKDNLSYKDDDSENKGGDYRNDGVDIEKGGDNYVVGYTMVGEWMEYTVNVKTSAEYDVFANVASGSESSGFVLMVDDELAVDSVKVEKTGTDWSTYKEIELGKASLEAGDHVLKIAITGDFVNIDWIDFRQKVLPEDPGPTVSPEDSGSTMIPGYSMEFTPTHAPVYVVRNMMGKAMGKVSVFGGDYESALKKARFGKGSYILQHEGCGAIWKINLSK